MKGILTAAPLLLGLSLLAGCILVRTSEQRVTLNADGSGEAVLRLVDIRSDGTSEEAVLRDFGTMMQKLQEEGMADFETEGRRVISRRFELRGDTLDAEIVYRFLSLDAVEGLHRTRDGLTMVVNDAREVVRTNGKTEPQGGRTRILWPVETRRLQFDIRERKLPPSTSLAQLYRKYVNP